MADERDSTAEPLFRANKRRKVFRKRDGGKDYDGDEIGTAPAEDVPASTNEERDESAGMVVPRARRPAVRKHGIAFTSTGPATKQQLVDSEEMATIPAHPDREQKEVPGDRFVKPTGKAAVVDDRHMMAFVDSKMAEIRSATPNSMQSGNLHSDTEAQRDDSVHGGAQAIAPAGTTSDNAQQRSASNYRRPRTQRRQPRLRDPDDLTRESLVESIMRESGTAAAPLYDRPDVTATTRDTADTDDAAAEAFKTQFLQDMAAQNRRRPPNPVPFSKVALAKGADRTAHGPKLGGSRMQRERMKAAQAAAEAAGKGK
ncbi:hypothetical protein LTR02_003753 [Friedmanniomyces endolithicus]|nr:hypothetical protein LTR94_012841 [Friedmanniomyces endolithicus]KAK0782138.1 hypothetical protein LTR59_012240 [Friedmanniomyces endolithicus]KAK0818532.1 hypothetical protein LTR38_001114 [Friedmanniomyces endolithicus]KAK0821066.1 hypothetical protein LTR75_001136 [Friedmanniomyces endolithicus]KAK0841385.1 hypothetical protein LTR03_009918 [Friedmanniomyces endolithicus]